MDHIVGEEVAFSLFPIKIIPFQSGGRRRGGNFIHQVAKCYVLFQGVLEKTNKLSRSGPTLEIKERKKEGTKGMFKWTNT